MKKKFLYTFVLLAAVFSCSDDFTKISPIGALSDEALQNAQGVDLKLTGAYARLGGTGGWTSSGDNWWFDAISDDAHKGSTDGDQANLFDIEMMTWTTANGYFLGKWQGLYAGVNRANAVIDLISQVEGADFTNQLAQARFLRGHFNFELQRIFGNPAYISEENYAATEFNQPNPGPIWDKIEADFQFAIDNLPASQDSPGRPTSWAAKAYMGKVALYQGKHDAAFGFFKDVIDNGPYALIAEYGDNFRLAGDNSSETIFSIQFAADKGQSFNGNLGGTLNFPGGGPFNSCCGFYQPTQDLANTFQTDASGLPLLDTYNQADIANDAGIDSDQPFTPHAGNLDPRIDFTVGRRGIDYNGWGTMVGKDWIRAAHSDISGPYLPKKNVYYAGEDGNRGTGSWGQQRSGINYHIIRYADVLLMGAEAATEKSSPDLAAALDYVNQVRNRAKSSTYVLNEAGDAPAANYVIEPYASFADAAFARKAIRFERRLELGMEGHRFFDLRRWGNAGAVLDAYIVNEARALSQANFPAKYKGYKSHYDLMPIPLDAIDLSGNILNQNTGY
ncbi:RagB/SusD family nutrient uptake outer membrane protein [Sediminicola luteus]|uniref:RagB/SusD family nutrient uptake outer membrane protein n=1 Tax=Sediminicola luteus TaxID=319238 RepID=A0A2A4G3N0_9FLAO|nr:RagB/SusD family nutrient uptake outer membrane protein [Sediminicola luteus]PCE62570.1 RagB/SusD family nutrient uptake outer membrane protein [Sediminicola luteus]